MGKFCLGALANYLSPEGAKEYNFSSKQIISYCNKE
jgi:hypothetical protein